MLKKICRISGKEFEITDDDLKFYEKMGVPEPTFCPDERLRLRESWRTQSTLYHRKCDYSGKRIISMYHPSSPFPVYHVKDWRDDEKFDPLQYGREFDFSRSFFSQYKDLLDVTPHPHAIFQYPIENSEYCNRATALKNCYLCFGMTEAKDCLYLETAFYVNDCVSSYMISNCELCYECINCSHCYECQFCQQCKNCSDSWFLWDCIGCKDCFGCTGLRNKQYYFANEPLTKEGYEIKLRELQLHKSSQLNRIEKEFLEFKQNQPHKHAHIINCEYCQGDNMLNCKNCSHCFDMEEAEDCHHCFFIKKGAKNCMDATFWGNNLEMAYQTVNCGNDSQHLRFCSETWNSTNMTYCINCQFSQDSFGCYGLKNHKQYCILNKQYSKEDYFALQDKIIDHMKQTGEWGEFFPASLSPFGYNETVAQEYSPLTKEQALAQGYKWKDEDSRAKYEGPKYEIPDDIADVTDEICDKILLCEATGKNYRIVKPELEFYRKMNLPIPRFCPEERHKRRIALRNPRKLWDRKCAECGCKIQTTYAPDRPEKVLCEECYLKVVD